MAKIKTARTPLWSRLAQRLAGDILSGRRPVGSLLPTEAQLMSDFSMSRHTVRSALAELVHLGLVERSPRRGTIVKGDGRDAEFTAHLSPSQLSDSENRELLFIRRIICNEAVSERTGFALLTPLITLAFLTKTTDGCVVDITELWIRDAARDLMSFLTPENAGSILGILEDHAGVRCRSMRQSAKAIALNSDCAQHLNAPAGSPGLVVTRVYLDRRPAPLIYSEEIRSADAAAGVTIFTRSIAETEPKDILEARNLY